MKPEYYNVEGNHITGDEWLELKKTREDSTIKTFDNGYYFVSTVWIGINMNVSPTYLTGMPPAIFETMIFGKGPLDLTQYRYATLGQALKGHKKAVTLAKRATPKEGKKHAWKPAHGSPTNASTPTHTKTPSEDSRSTSQPIPSSPSTP
jgi:hypothetical protein